MARITSLPGGQASSLNTTDYWILEVSGGTTKYATLATLYAELDDRRAVGCRLTEAGGQNINASAWTPINFDTEQFDHGGCHESVTNPSRITVPSGEKGIWVVGGIVSMTADSAGTRQARIRVNATTVIAQEENLDPGASVAAKLSLSTIYLLDAADYVQIEVLHSSTTDPLALDTTYTQFWAYQLTKIP